MTQFTQRSRNRRDRLLKHESDNETEEELEVDELDDDDNDNDAERLVINHPLIRPDDEEFDTDYFDEFESIFEDSDDDLPEPDVMRAHTFCGSNQDAHYIRERPVSTPKS